MCAPLIDCSHTIRRRLHQFTKNSM
jgi:hypothetical protein